MKGNYTKKDICLKDSIVYSRMCGIIMQSNRSQNGIRYFRSTVACHRHTVVLMDVYTYFLLMPIQRLHIQTLHDDAMHVMSPRTNMLRRFICRDNFYLYGCILLESTCKYDHIPVYLLLYQLLYVKIMLELCYCIVSLSSSCFLVTAKRS